jgi:hypothetical protein
VAKSYYSTVFDQSADSLWGVVRDFNAYPIWVDGAAESQIEGGNPGTTVGAVRSVLYDGARIRQRLLAQSDVERAQTYEFADAPLLPVRNYRATIRITPVVDGNKSFVEWWADYDCEPGDHGELMDFFRSSFGRWLESLRRTVTKAGV